MSGNARGASSAFCLLYRLGQLKPSDEEVQKFLDHSDSPFIRAVSHSVGTQLTSRCRLQGQNCTAVRIAAFGRPLLLSKRQFQVRVSSCFSASIQSSAAQISLSYVSRHDDNSVWVSQLGFLYLRYVLNPRQVWEWLQYYINDQEVGMPIKRKRLPCIKPCGARQCCLDFAASLSLLCWCICTQGP